MVNLKRKINSTEAQKNNQKNEVILNKKIIYGKLRLKDEIKNR